VEGGDEAGDAHGPPAGWALIGDGRSLDVHAVLARYGCVFRWPITDADADKASAMDPGQPCFLVLEDRSRTVGIWAVGSVVATTLELGAGTPLLPGEAVLEPRPDRRQARRWAEVELLALEKPIGRESLAQHRHLANSDLVHVPTGASVIALGSEEIHAVESFDFWLVEPDERQRAELDALLGAEDDLLG
jgi:hypothetical protein